MDWKAIRRDAHKNKRIVDLGTSHKKGHKAAKKRKRVARRAARNRSE